MTTIACNRREMAADGKITFDRGDYLIRTRRKIVRAGVAIVGSCGDLADGEKFVRWFASGQPDNRRPKLGEDFLALVLRPGGIFLFDEDCGEIEIECGWHAIGSGEQAARTMLSLGRSPREAVRKAIEFDNASGPPVIALRVPRLTPHASRLKR